VFKYWIIVKGEKMMKLNKLAIFFSCITALIAFSGGTADANGTLKITFKSNDGTPMSYTYLYLRDGNAAPPMEKYLSMADSIYGPFSNGNVSVSVPAGTYKVRVTRRGSTPLTRPYGPPILEDYTWSPHASITITDGVTTNLGTQYAGTFGTSAIVISGTVLNSTTGAPLVGKYIRAQSQPCIEGYFPHYYADDYANYMDMWVEPNHCGPDKYMAQAQTDANGNYTIFLRNAGTYYIIESNQIYGEDKWQEITGNRSVTGWEVGPITVNVGDQITMPNMMIPSGYR